MLSAQRCGLESAAFIHASLDQVHAHRVLKQLVPNDACELDVDLVLRGKIVEVEEHVQGAVLDTAAKVHDVAVPCDLATAFPLCIIIEKLQLIFYRLSDPVVPLDEL